MRSGSLVVAVALASGCMETNLRSQVPDPAVPAVPSPAIRIAPDLLDLGAPAIGCERAGTFTVHNDGDADLVVDEFRFEAASDDLFLAATPALPLVIAPGEGVPLDVGYLAFDAVPDLASLVALSNDPDRPEASADAAGAAASAGAVKDRFEEPLQPVSDILVVVDNSCSMAEEQANLTSNFQSFVDAVVAADADWRLAVITTDSAEFRGPVLTPASADPVGQFTNQALVGTGGSGEEQPLQMIANAVLPGADAAPGGAFFRDDSLLAIIVVTDEPDEYSAMTPLALTDYLVGLKGGDPGLVRLHAIGGDVPLPACASAAAGSVPLDEVAALSGGLFLSVCSSWGVSLDAVAQGSVASIDRFALSQEPLVPTLEVTVDGVAVTGWSWDAGTSSIVFDAGAIPAPGAVIEVHYEPLPDCTAE
jgi:hypothetical protein